MVLISDTCCNAKLGERVERASLRRLTTDHYNLLCERSLADGPAQRRKEERKKGRPKK